MAVWSIVKSVAPLCRGQSDALIAEAEREVVLTVVITTQSLICEFNPSFDCSFLLIFASLQ